MVKKPKNIDELLYSCPKNTKIYENIIKAWSIINRDKYKKIVCSISGGSDSDVILDITWKCDISNKVEYVWFDTGLEYQATKDHLRYLEDKYGIEIKKCKPIKSIPSSCKEYGQPFLSKYISEMIYRLQRHNFQWEDKPFEELVIEYPKCKSALQWWCNWHYLQTGRVGMYDISHKKLLKEFMVQNPPQFKISNKCCEYAKKKIGHQILKDGNYDLQIIGVRKTEGGVRSTAYKNCFDENISGNDNYRPIYFYSDSDKKNIVIIIIFNIRNVTQSID